MSHVTKNVPRPREIEIENKVNNKNLRKVKGKYFEKNQWCEFNFGYFHTWGGQNLNKLELKQQITLLLQLNYIKVLTEKLWFI